MKSQREEEYLIDLTKLVDQMNREDVLSFETQKMLDHATKWLCPNWDERILLDDLIKRAKEYIELEKKMIAQNCTNEENNKWRSLRYWFTEIQIDLRELKSILYKISLKKQHLLL
ncbi:MAG: hypothetical protein JXB49_36620 [Bacteroidales bacterium]|nr:hypothetical protein [Bacteroidales bacterium]